jgi:uncharacterized protein
VIVAGGECELRELVEDELILALPAFSYHEQADCNTVLVDLNSEAVAAPDRPNPFEVLGRLKPGDSNQE